MSALVDYTATALQRGISALRSYLGEDNAFALLKPVTMRADEVASFSFPLPIDFTEKERWLRIGFPSNFPRVPLRLHVEPSPWLVWPHAMRSGLCLHGFQERPITGSPEFVVRDSLSRLAKIVSLAQIGSSKDRRDAEFQNEITSYWSMQNGLSLQNLILLDRPQRASELFALSDPRHALPSGQETVWLATDVSVLTKHYKRIVGRFVKVRAAEAPGFYVKLQSYPSLRFPTPELLFTWLDSHLKLSDSEQLLSWFRRCGSLTNRWIALELPGEANAPIYCLSISASNTQLDRGKNFYLRTARRRPAFTTTEPPGLIRAATLDVLDRSTILSRDLSGVAHSLEKSRVVCVGVGSLGSMVALQLAQSGIGHLTLIDYDTLVSANLGRHVLGADDLGRIKAEALCEKIRRDLPIVEVTAYPTFAEVVMCTNPDVFKEADLIIVTTADWLSEVALWKLKSNGASWGLLQAWSEPHAKVGHALLAPVGSFDARYLFLENGDFKHKLTEWPGGGIIALPACGESFIPGDSLGVMNIASMVSEAALRALSGHVEDSLWVSSINRPQDVAALGGNYVGPELPEGVQQALLERRWPEEMESS